MLNVLSASFLEYLDSWASIVCDWCWHWCWPICPNMMYNDCIMVYKCVRVYLVYHPLYIGVLIAISLLIAAVLSVFSLLNGIMTGRNPWERKRISERKTIRKQIKHSYKSTVKLLIPLIVVHFSWCVCTQEKHK